MCQAYEAERNFIISMEMFEEKEGFKAAYLGKHVTEHPSSLFGYSLDAWINGFESFKHRVLPWGIGREFGSDFRSRREAEELFKSTGELNSSVKNFLGIKE